MPVINRLAPIFKLLGEPSRLRILYSLKLECMPVTDLVTATGLSQTNLSFHLRALREAGLVRLERRGAFRYYCLTDPEIFLILNNLYKWVEANSIENNISKQVFQLAYVSNTVGVLDISDIENIEAIAQKNNQLIAVTGIFLNEKSKFMQILEGPESSVTQIFSNIMKDSRHSDIHVIKRNFIPERQFSEWYMRYTLTSEIQDNSGIIYNKLFQIKAQTKKVIASAKSTSIMLLSFKNNPTSYPSLF